MAQRRVAVAAWRDNQQAGRHEVITLAQRVGLGLSGVCPGKPRFVKKRGAQKARVEQQRKINAKISG